MRRVSSHGCFPFNKAPQPVSNIRIAKQREFTTLSNHAANDPNLSFQAKGMIYYLMSKPDDWTISREHLKTVSTNGISSVRAILSELEEHGYLTRERMRHADGKVFWESTLYEVPPNTRKPSAEKPPVVFPPVENLTLLNTDIQKTELENTENTHTSFSRDEETDDFAVETVSRPTPIPAYPDVPSAKSVVLAKAQARDLPDFVSRFDGLWTIYCRYRPGTPRKPAFAAASKLSPDDWAELVAYVTSKATQDTWADMLSKGRGEYIPYLRTIASEGRYKGVVRKDPSQTPSPAVGQRKPVYTAYPGEASDWERWQELGRWPMSPFWFRDRRWPREFMTYQDSVATPGSPFDTTEPYERHMVDLVREAHRSGVKYWHELADPFGDKTGDMCGYYWFLILNELAQETETDSFTIAEEDKLNPLYSPYVRISLGLDQTV